MAPTAILIADHHDDSRIIYSVILQHEGYSVMEARTGAEALDMIPRHLPDAVIIELTLPEVEGCEILRWVKQHPRTRHIPVLVVTANMSSSARDEAFEAKCDAYLLKPCSPRDLLTAVRSVLEPTLPLLDD